MPIRLGRGDILETPIWGWLSNWCHWRRGTRRDSNRFRQAGRYGQRTSVHEGLTE
jgi:hypothetical protein